jgi:hypothetical protein
MAVPVVFRALRGEPVKEVSEQLRIQTAGIPATERATLSV